MRSALRKPIAAPVHDLWDALLKVDLKGVFRKVTDECYVVLAVIEMIPFLDSYLISPAVFIAPAFRTLFIIQQAGQLAQEIL